MKYALGIDIGGTAIKLAVVAMDGTIVEKTSIATDAAQGYGRVVEDIARAAGAMLEHLPAGSDVVGAGVGAPGPVDGRLLHRAVNLGWGETPLGEALKDALGMPAMLFNDANAAALGERWAAGIDGGSLSHNVLFITLGTGVGGGLIVNGTLVNGEHSCGGEIGHIPSGMHEGRVCGCGNLDCLECYASATGFMETARRLSGEQGVTPPSSCEELFARAKEGDALSARVIELSVGLLASAIAGIVNTVDPQDIIIGGGVSQAGPALLEPLERMLQPLVFPSVRGAYSLRLAQLGNDAGVVGSAFGAFEHAKAFTL